MKRIIIFLIFCNIISSYAQENIFNENNQLRYKEEESYKHISFNIEWYDTDKSEISLMNILRNNSDIFFSEYNPTTKRCNIDAKLSIDKAYINSLLGTKGYKISEYLEEVHLFVSTVQISESEQKRLERVRAKSDIYYREDFKNASSNSLTEDNVGTSVSSIPVKNKLESLSNEDKIKQIEILKTEALKRGESVEKYDIKLNDLKTLNK